MNFFIIINKKMKIPLLLILIILFIIISAILIVKLSIYSELKLNFSKTTDKVLKHVDQMIEKQFDEIKKQITLKIVNKVNESVKKEIVEVNKVINKRIDGTNDMIDSRIKTIDIKVDTMKKIVCHIGNLVTKIPLVGGGANEFKKFGC